MNAIARSVAARLVSAVVLVVVVTLVTFCLLQLVPGDVVGAQLPLDATPQEIAAQRAFLGLDRPLPVQYWDFLTGLMHGDLGSSYVNSRPVSELILNALPVTFSLALCAVIVAVPVALLLGLWSGAREGKREDNVITAWNSLVIAVPPFFFAIVLILVFAVKLPWLPSLGYVAFSDDPLGFIRHMTLPAVTLGLTLAAPLARQLRGSMAEVLAQDYITAAEARGVRWRHILGKNALRNAAIPTVTLFGLNMITLLGGSLIIEQLFALPGVGMLAISAAFNRDVPVIQGVVVVGAIMAIAINTAVDMAYRALNPKIGVR